MGEKILSILNCELIKRFKSIISNPICPHCGKYKTILGNALYLVLCVVFVSCSAEQMKEYNKKRQQEYLNSYEYREKQCNYIITVWGHGSDATPALEYTIVENGCCMLVRPTYCGWDTAIIHGNYLIEKK
jgi:hypothetical protein